MTKTALFLFLFGPQLSLLGHDDFKVREAATRKNSTLIFAFLAPDHHPDPEVQMRLRMIRNRMIPDIGNPERFLFRFDPRKFWELYMMQGCNFFVNDGEALRAVQGDQQLGMWLFDTFTPEESRYEGGQEREAWMIPPGMASDLPGMREWIKRCTTRSPF